MGLEPRRPHLPPGRLMYIGLGAVLVVIVIVLVVVLLVRRR